MQTQKIVHGCTSQENCEHGHSLLCKINHPAFFINHSTWVYMLFHSIFSCDYFSGPVYMTLANRDGRAFKNSTRSWRVAQGISPRLLALKYNVYAWLNPCRIFTMTGFENSKNIYKWNKGVIFVLIFYSFLNRILPILPVFQCHTLKAHTDWTRFNNATRIFSF
jgi:hypothetical protein